MTYVYLMIFITEMTTLADVDCRKSEITELHWSNGRVNKLGEVVYQLFVA